MGSIPHVATPDNFAALTFNDAPDLYYTPRSLDISKLRSTHRFWQKSFSAFIVAILPHLRIKNEQGKIYFAKDSLRRMPLWH
jgi:hypothetical protein